jgi:hypothetical protein
MERIYKTYATGLVPAGSAKSLIIAPAVAGVKWKIIRATRWPNIAVTADDTDYISERWYYDAGTSAPITAARPTTVAGTGFTLQTPEDVTFTGTPLQREATYAEPVHIDITVAGSGKAFDFNYEVEIEVVS